MCCAEVFTWSPIQVAFTSAERQVTIDNSLLDYLQAFQDRYELPGTSIIKCACGVYYSRLSLRAASLSAFIALILFSNGRILISNSPQGSKSMKTSTLFIS